MTQQIVPTNLTPVGHQQITDVSSAVSLTVPAGAKFAYIQAEDADIRWLDSGTAPTASLGTLLYAGHEPLPYLGDLTKLQFIDDAATTAVLNVSYYGYFGSVKRSNE